jgi:hypothetical protein
LAFPEAIHCSYHTALQIKCDIAVFDIEGFGFIMFDNGLVLNNRHILIGSGTGWLFVIYDLRFRLFPSIV